MKVHSSEYFSEARPFNDQDDACLLDAMEQMIAVAAESGIRAGWIISFDRPQSDGPRIVTVERPDGSLFDGKDIRSAIREALNAE